MYGNTIKIMKRVVCAHFVRCSTGEGSKRDGQRPCTADKHDQTSELDHKPYNIGHGDILQAVGHHDRGLQTFHARQSLDGLIT